MGVEQWSSKTRAVLEQAGWFPGRRVNALVDSWREKLDSPESPDGFVMSAVAREVLEEFGGLRSTLRGPGEECGSTPFLFEPTNAEGEEDRFARLGEQIDVRLFPLGELYDGFAFLGIDPQGRVYSVGDYLAVIADDIYRGIDALVVGRKFKVVVDSWHF